MFSSYLHIIAYDCWMWCSKLFLPVNSEAFKDIKAICAGLQTIVLSLDLYAMAPCAIRSLLNKFTVGQRWRSEFWIMESSVKKTFKRKISPLICASTAWFEQNRMAPVLEWPSVHSLTELASNYFTFIIKCVWVRVNDWTVKDLTRTCKNTAGVS